jgi:hypothetical protein
MKPILPGLGIFDAENLCRAAFVPCGADSKEVGLYAALQDVVSSRGWPIGREVARAVPATRGQLTGFETRS